METHQCICVYVHMCVHVSEHIRTYVSGYMCMGVISVRYVYVHVFSVLCICTRYLCGAGDPIGTRTRNVNDLNYM